MRKYFIFILALMLALSMVVVSSYAGESPFKDLDENHWSYDNVVKMAGEGIISGYPDKTFKPEATVTHAEFIKMVVAATKVEVPTVKDDEHWANKYYEASIENEYFTEYDIHKKLLDRPITRTYMALIVSSVLSDVEEYGNHNAILNSIDDVTYKTPKEYHIVRAYGMGILSGYPDKTFRPDGTLTRAEASTVIARLKDKIEGVELPTPVITPDPVIEEPINNPEEEVTPFIDTSHFELSAPEGTYMAKMVNDDGDITEELVALKPILIQQFPDDGEAIFEAIKTFALKDKMGKSTGICKQYVNGWPLQIVRPLNVLFFYVFPKDYSDEYWETRPGEVNEFFV